MNRRLILAIACVVSMRSFAVADEKDGKAKKGTVKAGDGLSIVYEDRGKGDTALLFLHGWCGDRLWWKNQVDAFAPDYRVVAIDKAGHGESGKDRKSWTVAGLADDVQAVVKELGLKRVILVGHSMGGPVSLAAAKRMPGTVVAVIGVDTLQNVEFKFPEEQAKQFLEQFDKDFKGTFRSLFKGMFPEKADAELVKWIAERAEAQDAKMAVGLMRDMMPLDQKALMKETKVPVRCINSGGGFQFFIPTDSDINKKYADFKAVTIEDVGHFPMLEKPKEFNEKLREVLKEFRTKE
jgi:pimeloyl-ACP methyl ester carboxylesterase